MKKVLPTTLLILLFQSLPTRAANIEAPINSSFFSEIKSEFNSSIYSDFSLFNSSIYSELSKFSLPSYSEINSELSSAFDNIIDILFEPFSYDDSLLFEHFDTDHDNIISFDELVNSSATEIYSSTDKMILWTLKKNHRHLFPLLGRDGFKSEDIQNYLTAFLANKVPYFLRENMESISDGLLPEGINSISHKNIYQGSIGDCGFISAVASLAYLRPDEIYNMLSENKDGSFDVKFPNNEKINVTPTLEAVYLGSYSGNNGAWPLALELAFSSWRNGLSENTPTTITEKTSLFLQSLPSITNSLDKKIVEIDKNFTEKLRSPSMEQSIHILTGKPTFKLKTQRRSAEVIRELIKIIHTEKRVAVAAIVSTEYKKSFIDPLNLHSFSHHVYKKELDPSLKEMTDSHVYSLLGYNSENDSVLIRDPSGYDEPLRPGSITALDGEKDGIFELKIEDFQELFDWITLEIAHDELPYLKQLFW